MTPGKELNILQDLYAELEGKCGGVCPCILAAIHGTIWECERCHKLFHYSSTMTRTDEEGRRYIFICPCTAFGEGAIVRLEERIRELREELLNE